ncbi:MAG: phosphate regulon sensor histidine kinase PhoR [Gammaproteobacteria bacterium]|nr:phosphate regulon sensor histidine kinase PhoR [Gammaproteobacteria bacterium]
MPVASRKFLLGLFLLLGAGTLIGWLYGHAERGLLVASLLALVWQVRQLITFNAALHTQNFDAFRYGDGIWQGMFSRFSYERDRGSRYKRQQRQLIKEIRKSTNAMPDGAVILDANNEIVVCNRAAKALAGLKPKKDRGQRVDNIVRNPKVTQLLQANDATLSVDIESPVRDDAWLNCRVVPYGAEQKLLLIRDVTDRIRLNRMRRDFVANASHELRSPLTVVSGYLDSLVDDDQLPADLVAPIARMQSQATRMTVIVQELLELSRLESSGKAGTDDIVDVAALLAAARKAYQALPDVAGIEVELESAARLLGNPNEIESVISNLVSNAVRHTQPGGSIRLQWRSSKAGAELSIIDSGEGIAPEHIPRLTERFFRVDRGRAREDGGIGLGLAIVKHILGRHDATLEVDSQVGQGSTFTAVFPAERLHIDAPIRLGGERSSH